MSITEPELTERIVTVLSPFMGPAMARASLKVYINEVKIVHGSFGPEHLDRIAARLQPGLTAFVGGEKARNICAEIRRLGEARSK